MALFVLLQDFRSNAGLLRAGAVVDDAQYDVPGLTAAGAALVDCSPAVEAVRERWLQQRRLAAPGSGFDLAPSVAAAGALATRLELQLPAQQTITATALPLLFTAPAIVNDGDFTGPVSNVLTCVARGGYFYAITHRGTNTSNTRQFAEMRILVNGSPRTGGVVTTYHRNIDDGDQTSSNIGFIDLVDGDTVGADIRSDAGVALRSEPDDTKIVLQKVRP